MGRENIKSPILSPFPANTTTKNSERGKAAGADVHLLLLNRTESARFSLVKSPILQMREPLFFTSENRR